MITYHAVHTHLPLRDSGNAEFHTASPEASAIFEELLGPYGPSGGFHIYYDQYRQLLQLLHTIQRRLPSSLADAVMCRISYEEQEEIAEQTAEHEGWVPISRLFANVGPHQVIDYIVNQRFTSHMQPIVQLNGQAIGYEFLLRPLPEQPPFRPAELFSAAREAGLHSFLDREARSNAIRVASRQLPAGVKKFINFLPSSIHRPEECLLKTFEHIIMSGMDPADFVFEVVETERLDNIQHLNRVFSTYRNQGIQLAMDDLGDGYATMDMVEQLQPDYVKLDRKWVTGCHEDAGKQRRIEEVMERAARFHGVVLAEGVEREEEWQYLREAGVPLLQGYLFGKPAPVPMPVNRLGYGVQEAVI